HDSAPSRPGPTPKARWAPVIWRATTPGLVARGPDISRPPVGRGKSTVPLGGPIRRGSERPTEVGSDRAVARRPRGKEDEMSVTMVRQKVKNGSLDEAEAAVRDLFTTFARVRPQGLRYASTRVVDGSTFVILFELADDVEDPRPWIPEYGEFVARLQD